MNFLYTLSSVSESDSPESEIVINADTSDANVIYLDLAFGNISFTDTAYSAFDENGDEISGEHLPTNIYKIIQSVDNAVSNTVAVGDATTPVNTKFEIHLCGVNIDAPKSSSNHKAAFYVNTNSDNVFIVIDNDTTNILKSYGLIFTNGSGSSLLNEKDRFGHAAIEKEINTKGSLIITCENGYFKYQEEDTSGHNCSVSGNCGVLQAYSIGEAGFYNNSTRTSAAAAIGSKAEVSTTSHNRRSLTNAPTMGTLYNLIIAGGVITARGSTGNKNGDPYLGGSPGIGVGAGLQQYSIGYEMNNLKITGGYIESVAGDGSSACIGGGYHAGYVTVNIYGGTLLCDTKATNSTDPWRGAGIGGGGGGSISNATAGATVNIYDGIITAKSEFGAAIGAGAGGTSGIAQPAIINIYGGAIAATTTKGTGNGAGAAIGAGGSLGTGKGGEATITISGGTIIASSELGADIGGGGTNSTSTSGVGGEGIITISGGNITAMSGGIGGGNANAGKGGNAKLTISGGTINASKINGGNSERNNGGSAIVTIADGVVNTGYIGGGVCTSSTSGKIGSAEVQITGGQIFGQIIMDSTNLSSGAKCYFKMSGGTIDMTKPNNGFTFTPAQKNGAAIYIIGSGSSDEPIAQFSGGIIKNGSANNGGAIYIAGGGSMLMSGGTIDNFSAVENGGAIYIDGGNFEMTNGTITNCQAQNGGAIFVKGGEVYVHGGYLDNNVSIKNGGAIYVENGNLEMTSGTITNCQAQNGGAIFVKGGAVDIINGYLNHNKAQENGGAIYIEGGNIDMHNGVIDNNIANNNGGAIYATSNSTNVTINIYDGEITNNSAGRHAGAIGANVTGTYSATINIGLEACKAINKTEHDDDSCPILKNNTASISGGAICLHAEKSTLVVNIYCGQITDNIAVRYEGTNSINQEGGVLTIYGGEIEAGISVGLGTYDDQRPEADENHLIMRLWANYDGGPLTPVLIDCTLGVTLNLPGTVYYRDGHVLSGWTTVPNTQTGWNPVGGRFVVRETDDGYMDLYAVWDATVSYIVYIPDTIEINNEGIGSVEIRADLNFFKENSTLNIFIDTDFKLTCTVNSLEILNYQIRTSELGVTDAVKNGDLVASFQYDNTISKILTITVLDKPKYANPYQGVITFIIDYEELEDEI